MVGLGWGYRVSQTSIWRQFRDLTGPREQGNRLHRDAEDSENVDLDAARRHLELRPGPAGRERPDALMFQNMSQRLANMLGFDIGWGSGVLQP